VSQPSLSPLAQAGATHGPDLEIGEGVDGVSRLPHLPHGILVTGEEERVSNLGLVTLVNQHRNLHDQSDCVREFWESPTGRDPMTMAAAGPIQVVSAVRVLDASEQDSEAHVEGGAGAVVRQVDEESPLLSWLAVPVSDRDGLDPARLGPPVDKELASGDQCHDDV